MDKKTYKLFNRDCRSIFLEHEDGDTWSLDLTNLGELAQYIRCCYLDNKQEGDGEYEFIDPPGGPLIYIGTKFNNLGTITAIWHNKDKGRFEMKIEEDKDGK